MAPVPPLSLSVAATTTSSSACTFSQQTPCAVSVNSSSACLDTSKPTYTLPEEFWGRPPPPMITVSETKSNIPTLTENYGQHGTETTVGGEVYSRQEADAADAEGSQPRSSSKGTQNTEKRDSRWWLGPAVVVGVLTVALPSWIAKRVICDGCSNPIRELGDCVTSCYSKRRRQTSQLWSKQPSLASINRLPAGDAATSPSELTRSAVERGDPRDRLQITYPTYPEATAINLKTGDHR